MVEKERQPTATPGKSRRFVELIPERWREGPDLWCRAYRMVGVPLDAVQGSVAVDLRRQLVVFFWGGMPKQSLDIEFEPTIDGTLAIGVRGQDGYHPAAPTALVMAPMEGDWSSEMIERCRHAIHEAAGVLSLHSLSLVAIPLEDYRIRLPEGHIEPTAVKLVAGGWLQPPAIGKDLVDAFEEIGRVLDEHPERERIGLALRWMDDAARTEGADAFIKAWVALETLAMPDTTNIRPMNEELGRIYGISADAARERFLTGRLAGLRASIVHDGDVAPIEDKLIHYLHALFKDLLFAQIGTATALADAKLSDPELGLHNYIAERTTPVSRRI